MLNRSRSNTGRVRCVLASRTLRFQDLFALNATQMFVAVKKGLIRRAAIGRKAASSCGWPAARDPTAPLPECVGIGNLMVATWAIGRVCTPEVLEAYLSMAPWDVIVLVMSTAVTDSDPIQQYLSELARVDAIPWRDRRSWDTNVSTDVLAEKKLYRLGSSHRDTTIFIALHKAKVKKAMFVEWYIRSQGPMSGLRFGTLKLELDPKRQRFTSVSVGIIDVRTEVPVPDREALAAWAVLDRIDALTGFFGNSVNTYNFVASLARRTKAIGWTPLYQAVEWKDHTPWVHPTWWLFFGRFRKIKLPEQVPAVAESLWLGGDLWHDMLPQHVTPSWDCNAIGSPLLQTCVWIGTATPGRGSQRQRQRQRQRRR